MFETLEKTTLPLLERGLVKGNRCGFCPTVPYLVGRKALIAFEGIGEFEIRRTNRRDGSGIITHSPAGTSIPNRGGSAGTLVPRTQADGPFAYLPFGAGRGACHRETFRRGGNQDRLDMISLGTRPVFPKPISASTGGWTSV